jgi:hypothetical protein
VVASETGLPPQALHQVTTETLLARKLFPFTVMVTEFAVVAVALVGKTEPTLGAPMVRVGAFEAT